MELEVGKKYMAKDLSYHEVLAYTEDEDIYTMRDEDGVYYLDGSHTNNFLGEMK